MQNILIGVGVLAMLSNIVILIMIMVALDRRGYKTSILLARLLIFKYISDYKKVTRKEAGRPGLLFSLWIISVNIAALAFILAIVWT